jgi:uncharacterized membrane protein YraQ (UPF0718 family)
MSDFTLVLLSLMIQGMPFLVAGAMLGALAPFIPVLPRLFSKIPRNPVAAACTGACLAPILPSCECIVIVMLPRLLQAGLPAPAALAYLLAAPTLNPVALAGTWAAFSSADPWMFTAWRAGGGWILAVALALVLQHPRLQPVFRTRLAFATGPRAVVRAPAWSFRSWLAMSVSDFWSVAGYYTAGVLCAASLQTVLPAFPQLGERDLFATPLLMLAAFLLCLCSSVDAFIANSFVLAPLDAKMAFLWLGPILDLKLVFLYRTLLHPRACLALCLAAPLLVWALSLPFRP